MKKSKQKSVNKNKPGKNLRLCSTEPGAYFNKPKLTQLGQIVQIVDNHAQVEQKTCNQEIEKESMKKQESTQNNQTSLNHIEFEKLQDEVTEYSLNHLENQEDNIIVNRKPTISLNHLEHEESEHFLNYLSKEPSLNNLELKKLDDVGIEHSLNHLGKTIV